MYSIAALCGIKDLILYLLIVVIKLLQNGLSDEDNSVFN